MRSTKSLVTLPSAPIETPPATPLTWGWAAWTPLSMTATVTPRPVARADDVRVSDRVLDIEKIREPTASRHQIARRAFLHHARIVDDHNTIRSQRKVETVSDDDGGASAHHCFVAVDEQPLRNRIERRGWL